jgi:hypothetical protein
MRPGNPAPAMGPGTGVVVVTDQVPGESVLNEVRNGTNTWSMDIVVVGEV